MTLNDLIAHKIVGNLATNDRIVHSNVVPPIIKFPARIGVYPYQTQAVDNKFKV